MNQYGSFLNTETLQFKRVLTGNLELVWDCLTKSEHKAKWLSGGDVENRVGGKVTHNFDHHSLSGEYEPLPEKYKDIGETSTMYGEVTVWDPYSKLSYTWNEVDNTSSEVSFELSEAGENKVLLILTHKRVPDSHDFKIGVSAGWHTHLNILEDVLNEDKIKGFWSVHMPLEEEYEKLI